MSRIVVSPDDIARIVKTVSMFGAVRREAFLEFIETYFDCGREAAMKITRTMTKRKLLHSPKNTYTGWQILKKHQDIIVDVDKLDAFEAYVELFKSNNEDAEAEEVNFIHVGKREFPYDYTFAADHENLYRVIIFDDNGYQKLSFSSKDNEKWGVVDTLLLVIPSKYSPTEDELKIVHKHRIAVVRTQKRKVACRLSGIIEE